MSHDTPTNSHTGSVLAVVVAAMSLVVLISLVALCAGSSTFEPRDGGGVTLQK